MVSVSTKPYIAQCAWIVHERRRKEKKLNFYSFFSIPSAVTLICQFRAHKNQKKSWNCHLNCA